MRAVAFCATQASGASRRSVSISMGPSRRGCSVRWSGWAASTSSSCRRPAESATVPMCGECNSPPNDRGELDLRRQLEQERDVRRQLEQRLREIEQSHSFGVSFGLMASGVIHDLNNLLWIIQSSAELLLKDQA